MEENLNLNIPVYKNFAFYAAIVFIIAIFFLVIFPDGFNGKKKREARAQTPTETSDTVVKVVGVYAWDGFTNRVLARHVSKKRLYMNGYIALEVNNIKLLNKQMQASGQQPVLYFNDIPMRSLKHNMIDQDNSFVIFYLDQADSSLQKCSSYFKNLFSPWPINNITMGIGPKIYQTTAYGYLLYPIDRHAFLILFCMIAFVICAFRVLTRSTDILRVASTQTKYSLAYTQIAFWTVIVLVSYIYLWLSTQEYNTINPTALIIMGISAATATGSRSIAKRMVQVRLSKIPAGNTEDIKNATTIPQGKGFVNDLFCDENGSSISRFQMILWTLLMGLVFIWVVVKEKKFPEFNESQLLLIGISSGAYLLLKPFEQPVTNP